MASNGFFAVSRDTFVGACELGINPACAFLVLACGTGKDNATTRWSAEAVGNHAGMRWSAAKEAITALCGAGLVAKGGKPSRPSYKLHKGGAPIWLPRTLVEGAAGEVPPVAKMRQTQDPMALRLLVELYTAQNLREDGGISTDVYHVKYERRRAGERGAYVVWDFTEPRAWVTWGDVTRPHRDVLTKQEEAAGKNAGTGFFRRFEALVSLGLVEIVPYLYDGPQGEPMHPMTLTGLPIERELYMAATDAADRMLGESWAQSLEDTAVPVQKHITEAALIGMARLRYRPQTRLTGAWWAEHQSICSAFIDSYNALAVPVQPAFHAAVPSAFRAANSDFGTPF